MGATVVIPVFSDEQDASSAFQVVDGDQTPLHKTHALAKQADKVSSVLVVSDCGDWVKQCRSWGMEAIELSSKSRSLLDIVAEVSSLLDLSAQSMVLTLDWRECLQSVTPINQVIQDLAVHENTKVAVLYCQVSEADNHGAYVVFNARGYVQYLSRSCIPFVSDQAKGDGECRLYRLVGITAYRAGLFVQMEDWDPCPYVNSETIDLLHLIWNGLRIHSTKIPSEEAHLLVTKADT